MSLASSAEDGLVVKTKDSKKKQFFLLFVLVFKEQGGFSLPKLDRKHFTCSFFPVEEPRVSVFLWEQTNTIINYTPRKLAHCLQKEC